MPTDDSPNKPAGPEPQPQPREDNLLTSAARTIGSVIGKVGSRLHIVEAQAPAKGAPTRKAPVKAAAVKKAAVKKAIKSAPARTPAKKPVARSRKPAKRSTQ